MEIPIGIKEYKFLEADSSVQSKLYIFILKVHFFPLADGDSKKIMWKIYEGEEPSSF